MRTAGVLVPGDSGGWARLGRGGHAGPPGPLLPPSLPLTPKSHPSLPEAWRENACQPGLTEGRQSRDLTPGVLASSASTLFPGHSPTQLPWGPVPSWSSTPLAWTCIRGLRSHPARISPLKPKRPSCDGGGGHRRQGHEDGARSGSAQTWPHWGLLHPPPEGPAQGDHGSDPSPGLLAGLNQCGPGRGLAVEILLPGPCWGCPWSAVPLPKVSSPSRRPLPPKPPLRGPRDQRR